MLIYFNMNLSITIEGEKQVSRKLGILDQRIQDFRTPLTKSVQYMLRIIDRNFDMSGGLFGGWAPRKDNNPWPLLQKSGRMRGGFIDEVRQTEAIIGNNISYFRYHQSNKPRYKLPRRIMMMIRNADATHIVKNFHQHALDTLKGSNLK